MKDGTMTTETKTTTYNRYLLAVGIILIIAIIGVIVSIVFTFARTGSNEETISTFHEEVVALEELEGIEEGGEEEQG